MTKESVHEFSAAFDDEFEVGPAGNNAFFGRNVLRGLVEGIDDFTTGRQSRWKGFRSLGPVMLGSAMWIDDNDLIEALRHLSAVCVIVKKPSRNDPKLALFGSVNEQTPGMPIAAFSSITGLAPKVDGQPLVVGPYSPMDDAVVPAIRALGYRRVANRNPPIIHAKSALLGHLWWHDEGPIGNVDDVIGFTPKRLWISSANFTSASRKSLEFGYWSEDKALLNGAERFLVRLMASSEPTDSASDHFDPELVPVEFDDEAMHEALRDSYLGPEDDEAP